MIMNIINPYLVDGKLKARLQSRWLVKDLTASHLQGRNLYLGDHTIGPNP